MSGFLKLTYKPSIRATEENEEAIVYCDFETLSNHLVILSRNSKHTFTLHFLTLDFFEEQNLLWSTFLDNVWMNAILILEIL